MDETLRQLERQQPGTKRLAMAKYRAGASLTSFEKIKIIESLDSQGIRNLYWDLRQHPIWIEKLGDAFKIAELEVLRRGVNVFNSFDAR